MSRYPRTYACEDCSEVVTRVRDTRQPLICLDCGTKRLVESSRQLAAKAGPHYDHWLRTAGPRGRPPIPK